MLVPSANTFVSRIAAFLAALIIVACLGLCGCGAEEGTSGAPFTPPKTPANANFDASKASGSNGAYIDASSAAQGYVAVRAQSSQRLKFQILCGDASQNYDVPSGHAIICPLTFGDGSYTFRVLKNTRGTNYVEICRTQVNVALESEFAPFLRPNVFCTFDAESACVKKARELTRDAENEGDALMAICTWIVDNVSYDNAKAEKLKNATGYVPSPDDTLSSKTGVCFDYASLGAAMLRSQGIPTKIITGYVSPDSIYHAWICVYIDGTWKSARFSIDKNTWSRVDLTFAAGSGNSLVGDGKDYTDRYIY